MTRIDIAMSLKPLVWREDELNDGTHVLSADYDVYKAYIEEENDGTATIRIFVSCDIHPVKQTGFTMQEAKDMIREHQVDSFCSCFNLDEPTKNAQL